MKTTQPLLLYPRGHELSVLPVGPIVQAVQQIDAWYALHLGQPWAQMASEPLIVGWTNVPVAKFRSDNTIAAAAVQALAELGLPDSADVIYLLIIRGAGGYAGTFWWRPEYEGKAVLCIVGDYCAEALAQLPRPWAMDKGLPDWPEAWRSTDGQLGALAHERLHGLMLGKDRDLWGSDQHSPYGANLLSGDYSIWPNCGLSPEERLAVRTSGWVTDARP